MNGKTDSNGSDQPEREKAFSNESTSLDERTHEEMLALYRESVDTIRFAKHMQWWTVGSTLVVFFAFIAIAKFVGADMTYAKILTALTIFFAMSGIFALLMYQFWQHNESLKITELSKHMSSLWRRVRKVKSRREANFHRYTLLIFMIATIVIGGTVTYFGVLQVAEHNKPGYSQQYR